MHRLEYGMMYVITEADCDHRCPPCKRIAPVFDKIAKDTVGAAFIKIDVDQLSDAAAAAGIQSVPTFQFRDGQKTLFEVSSYASCM